MPNDEIKIAILQTQVENLDKKVDGIADGQKELNKKMDSFITNYVTKDDFLFWRNLFVGGLLLTIAIAVIAKYLNVPKP